jgi:hypothetical protein
MSNGVVVVGSYLLEKLPSREDYFGESKYYSVRFAAPENHTSPEIGEGKYYSPTIAASENHTPPEKSQADPNKANIREDEHVDRAEDTGLASNFTPEINRDDGEYYDSPPKASIDALILFSSSYQEDNRKRYFKKRYLVCNSCGGYYQLQEDEEPDDFSDECECGGNLELRTSKK